MVRVACRRRPPWLSGDAGEDGEHGGPNPNPDPNPNQVKTESMVEDISNILNAGEVPNLFPGDEVSSMI